MKSSELLLALAKFEIDFPECSYKNKKEVITNVMGRKEKDGNIKSAISGYINSIKKLIDRNYNEELDEIYQEKLKFAEYLQEIVED